MSKVYSNEDFGRPIAGKYQSLNLPQQQQQQQGQGQQQQRPVPVRARSFSVGSLRSGDEAVVGCEKESCWKPWLRRKVPAFGWLISPGYSLTDLPDDLIAGITISTVVIPQSMAYAMLAPLPPVYGLYTSVAPILIYCIFGTSRHMHTGTFAITTLLLGQAVRGLMAKTDGAMGDLANTLLYDSQPFSELPSDDPEYERRFIGLLLMLSFVVGCIQVIMSFLRIGGWASKHLLPDALVGGFNTAAVFHIGTSQLKHFLGIKTMPSPQGAFALLKSWMWIGTHFLTETNWHTVFLGFVAIAFMVLLRNTDPVAAVAQERQIYVPIPDILLAVILLTLANVIFSLDTPRSEGGWGIDVMGTIPKGLPEIIFPASRITSGPKEWMTLEFLKTVILPMVQPALLIAVVIYVMSFSIAKQFGKRYGYKVDANQEMLALGLASMGGSIFSGYACTGSLTRTAILSQAGAKTPLASMVGVATVILTLISLTWCFERVPNVVLAAIILVALQSLLMQITEPLKLWRIGQRKAALIWMVTFVGVLIVSVELGIAIGIAAVLLSTGYSRVVRRCRGEDEPVPSQRRRNSRRPSQGVLLPPNGGATGSLLNNTAVASAAANNQRRRGYDNGVQLSASASPASRGADWKRRMMRTKWGQRLGSIFGLERPIFSDTLHTNTDDDDY
ncbi:sulfate transporter family-domain-containing protein [Dissophora ornata]|nr:sulfate transporter family-domain-containing protein [Dissophora ornata]